MLPTIDLTAADAAQRIGAACETVGFFQVVGHGVPQTVIETAWTRVREFFDLPLEQRMAAARVHDDDAYGYLPMELESLNRSLGGDEPAPPDLKQTFNIGPFVAPSHPLDDEGAAWAFAPTPWPPALPELRSALAAYYDEMDRLAQRLMRCFARALELPERFFDGFIDDAPGALRALDYPDLRPDLGQASPLPGQLRAGAHTDYGTLTILRQDDAPGGLQVLDPRTEQWVAVPADPAAFVVNLGDLMQQWTNDRWRSTLHRVVVPPAGSGPSRRQSMAFFHNANYHARIECLPTCVAHGEQPHHAAVIAGPHLQSKFRRAVGREY